MSWNALPPEVRDTAEQACTPEQLAALKLWHNGAGYKRISLILGIGISTARGRIDRALTAIANHKETDADRPDPVRKQDRKAAKSQT